MSAVDDIVAQVLSSKRLRRRVPTYREFSATIKIYAGPAHVKGTPYRYGSDPCQAYLIDQLDSGRWKRIYCCAPPQYGGKTLVLIILVALRLMIGSRIPVGYALPTLADLDKAWEEKLKPGLKGSGYGAHLPASGPGSQGGRGHTLQLTDPATGEAEGMVVFLAGGGYGSTVGAALIDEIDQFRTAAGAPQWGDIEDIFNRANAFGAQAVRIGCGTIEEDKDSIILPLVNDEGTGTRPHPRCPFCRRWVLLSWDHVVADYSDEQTAAETARIRCPSCQHDWTEDDRQLALKDCRFPHKGQTVTDDGSIIGPEPRTESLGLLWNALETPHSNLGMLAREYQRAQEAVQRRAEHGPMRKFYRYRRCELYAKDRDQSEQAAELTWEFLWARAHACSWGPVVHLTDRGPESDQHTFSRHVTPPPDVAQYCCAGVDIQNNRAYVVLDAVDADGGTYAIGWSVEYARPDRQPWNRLELHTLLDRINFTLRRWAGDLPLVLIALDCGDFTDDLRAWVDPRTDGWVPIKGTDRVYESNPDDVDGLAWNRDGLWHIHGRHSRELVHAALRRPNGTPGAAHLPAGLTKNGSDTAHLKHLVNERLIIDRKTGKTKLSQSGRWDWLDGKRYAAVMIRIHQQSLSRPPVAPIDLATWNRRR